MGYLAGAVDLAIEALYMNGRWSEIDSLVSVLEDAWEQLQHDVSTTGEVAAAYFTLLDIALSREDRAAANRAASVIERCLPEGQAYAASGRAVLAALRDDDPGYIDFDQASDAWDLTKRQFLNEHGVHALLALIERLGSWTYWGPSILPSRSVEIAEALAAEDLTRLATAIDEAEVKG